MVEVRLVEVSGLTEPLKLLELAVRDGEPTPRDFAGLLRGEIERGSIEVLTAHLEGSTSGVAVVAFRISVSAGGCFASIEELYVKPEDRRRGVGHALLKVVERRCTSRSISYVEVQVVEEEAVEFYRASGYQPESGVRVLSRSVALRETGD